MDRRSFLLKSAGGAILVGSGLAGSVGSEAALSKPKPKYLGYRVGDVAADLKGLDQYNRSTRLSGLRGRWVMIDVCAEWCAPCAAVARSSRNFIDSIDQQAPQLGLTLFTVITQDTQGLASPRTTAERWAVAFGLERDSVLHCGGDSTSPLFGLEAKYGLANDNPEGGAFPCYVLVDPNGVIRHYQGGADLNALRDALASLAQVPLAGDWSGGPVPATYADVSVDARFGIAGGSEQTLSGPFPAASSMASSTVFPDNGGTFFSVFGTASPYTVTIELAAAPGLAFDPDVAIRFAAVTAFNRSYFYSYDDPVGLSPVWAFDADGYAGYASWRAAGGGPFPAGVLPIATGPVKKVRTVDPTGFGLAPFTISELEPTGAPGGPVVSLLLSFGFDQRAPYTESLALQADVAGDPSLSGKVRRAVAKNLVEARSELTKRDYADAASEFTAATSSLRNANASPALEQRADALAAHAAWLAT